MLDPTYRNTLQIKAGSFGLSAVLPTPQMLHDISTLMQPAAPQIFAQLHKINVYSPGGMFMEHTDTPTCAAQFGSLVVALPYEFEGGELVVTHAGQSVTLTLGGGGNRGGSMGGSSGKEGIKAATAASAASPAAAASSGGGADMRAAAPAQAEGTYAAMLRTTSDMVRGSSEDGGGGGGGPLLHFAAFFSDCIHEVLPVRSGHRVTLTFNLLMAEGEGEAEAELEARRRKRRVWEAQPAYKRFWQIREPGEEQLQLQQQPLLSAVRPLAGGSIPVVANLRELMAQVRHAAVCVDNAHVHIGKKAHGVLRTCVLLGRGRCMEGAQPLVEVHDAHWMQRPLLATLLHVWWDWVGADKSALH